MREDSSFTRANGARPRVLGALTVLILTTTLLPAPASAESFERIVSLDDRGFRIEPGPEGAKIVLSGPLAPPEVGQPEIPDLILEVAVPAARTIHYVATSPLDVRHVRDLAVRETPDPTGRAATPDASAHAESAWQPAHEPSVVTTGFRDGYRILAVRVSPLRYQASSASLEVWERFTVRLEVGAATEAPDALVRLREPRTSRAERERRLEDDVDWVLETVPETSLAPRGGAFRPTEAPSLEGSGVDLVIVTPAFMAPAFDELVAWKNATGVRTVVRTTEWVVSNYEAPDVPARIRAFLRDAYVHWGIEFAILGGDTNVLPIRYATSRYNAPEGAFVACDYYMSCLDGDWNANGNHLVGEGPRTGIVDDEADLEPDIYVGRFPVDTFEEAQLLAKKVMWYRGEEPQRFDATYQETISFYAEALTWTPESAHEWPGTCDDLGFDGGAFADEVYTEHMPASFQANAKLYYETVDCWAGTPYTPIAESRQSVISDFNSGRHFVIHIGHGFRNNMAIGAADQKLYNGDADTFQNANRLSVLYAINCNSGAVDFDAIGEHFLLNDAVQGSGGAVVVIAATDLDYPLTSRHHMNTFMDDALHGLHATVGASFYETTRSEFAAYAATTDLSSRWTVFSLVLLGDPSLEVWSELPATFTVDAPASYEMGSGPLTVGVLDAGTQLPVDGASVTVYKEGEVHLTASTDPTGTASLSFEPPTAGPYTVGVAMRNHVAQVFQGNVTAPPAEPHLVVSGCTVTEISGNGDDVADVGETLSVVVDVENLGGVEATDVELTAQSASPILSVLFGTPTVGTVPAGGTVASSVMVVGVDGALPAGLSYQYADLLLDFAATNGSWSRVLPLRVGEARVAHVGLQLAEVIGNGDALFDVGERWSVAASAYNAGGGRLVGGTVSLETLDPLVVAVVDGSSAIDPAPATSATGDPLTFDVVGAGTPALEIVYTDATGELLRRTLDFDPPEAPADAWPVGGVDYVRLNWEPSITPDVQGYNVYREVSARGESWARVNEAPVVGGFFADLGLPALTPVRFRVASVDSSGNEGAQTAPIDASTAPPPTTGFPVDLTGAENRGSVTVADLDQDGGVSEVLVGSDYLYVVRGDGTEYVDGDGQPSTLGIFSGAGFLPGEPVRVFWTKPAVADIDLDGVLEIVVGHMESGRLYCFDANGDLEWGGAAFDLGDNLWSSPAIGNIDTDPELEIVIWSGSSSGPFRGALCAFNHDGSQVTDGDNNPSTNGVLAKSSSPGSAYNYGSVALCDIDGDGIDEIMAGERFGTDGLFYIIEVNPTPIPTVSVKIGWPYDPPGGGHQFTSSPALVDADGDGEREIYVVSRRALHALETDGSVRPNYPKFYTESTLLDFNDFLPSPVVGEFNGDGLIDVIHGWADGRIYAYTAATGTPLPGFPLQVNVGGQNLNRAFFNGALANVDGDPEGEFVIGTGGGELYAFNGDGSIVGGFPYSLGGAIYGAPAILDIDDNGSVDIVFTGASNKLVSLEMTGVPYDLFSSHWPQWRHDARNSGVYRADVTVGTSSAPPPHVTRLLPNVPNPAAPATTIRFDVGGESARAVRLSIYDVAGRRVARLAHDTRAPGSYTVDWDGHASNGRALGSGVYLYELVVGETRVSRKLLLIR